MREKRFISLVTIFITIIMVMVLSPMQEEVRAADRGRIAFVSADSGRWELYTIEDIRETRPQQLTDSAHDKRTPRWSPDGSKIAYATMQGDLYIVDAASREIQVLQLPSISNAEAVWSPDGTALVYVSCICSRESSKPALGLEELQELGISKNLKELQELSIGKNF